MVMKFYYSPGACSLAPHILLKETNTPAELVRVDTSTHKVADGRDFYAINAKGYVPVLELDDGQRLTEGPVIAQYIADQAKREDLMPAAGTQARYRVMEWQNYITSELHKSFSPLFSATHAPPAKEIFAGALRKKLAWVSSGLSSQAYLTGNTFTAADAYLFTVTSWARHVNLDLSDLKPLQEFLRRVADRSAVQAALQAEGLGGR
jgi:glutathione S-transferase